MLLHVGSRGDEVKKIQEKLGLKADGIFGAGTEKAVKTWQAAHGLTADGIVGAATWGSMFTNAPAGVQFDNLVGHVPEAVLRQIPECIEKFQINSALRLAHFLAQCGHESGATVLVVKGPRMFFNPGPLGLARVSDASA